ncbi:hypothetical protein RJ641_000508 [Dillenia turbinata]|uniref:Viral late gene transcription factor 3 zinc ribbon domain-containing protein n=1 Tax=Dillenia turbinata TaxID=194707 RepID=A0AAN8W889_9MAGN
MGCWTCSAALTNSSIIKASFSPNPTVNLIPTNITRIRGRRLVLPRAIDDISAAADPAQVQVTWQIVAGAVAGVTPFVVAAIEFSKRIVAQKRCSACGGSGLVQRENYYFRCPSCGGFLPWQSWKRFFSG